jgi:hypothetical protein
MSASLFWFERLPDPVIHKRAAGYLRQSPSFLKFFKGKRFEESRASVDRLLKNLDSESLAIRSRLLIARDHLSPPLLQHDAVQLFGDLSEAKLAVAAFFTRQDVFQMTFRMKYESKTMQFFTASGVRVTVEAFGEPSPIELKGQTILSTGAHIVTISKGQLYVDALQYGIALPGQNVTIREGDVFVDGLTRDPE